MAHRSRGETCEAYAGIVRIPLDDGIEDLATGCSCTPWLCNDSGFTQPGESSLASATLRGNAIAIPGQAMARSTVDPESFAPARHQVHRDRQQLWRQGRGKILTDQAPIEMVVIPQFAVGNRARHR